MSACDTCRNPGRCCVGMDLNGGALPKAETPLGVVAELQEMPQPTVKGDWLPLPFLPLYRRPTQDGSVSWLLWCPMLSREGRCTIYENRPWLCQHYQPKQDALCAEYDGVPK